MIEKVKRPSDVATFRIILKKSVVLFSSISTVMNALPSMLWADLFSHFSCFKNSSERCKTITNKFISKIL